jgi:hypothetical protein
MRFARHIRSAMVAAAFMAVLVFAPVGSSAAGSAIYSVKGTLHVIPKSNEGPGYWSMSGTVNLIRGAGNLPKSGTLSASGPLGAVAIIGPSDLGATTGAMKITWSTGPQPEPPTKAIVVHAMTHPLHTLTGRISSGFGKAGVIIIWLQHKTSNSFTGQVGAVAPLD